jgi:hypothetical protein
VGRKDGTEGGLVLEYNGATDIRKDAVLRISFTSVDILEIVSVRWQSKKKDNLAMEDRSLLHRIFNVGPQGDI